MIKEKAYAKINIALEVMEEVDGYHKVENIMLPISICDELEFEHSNRVYVENDTIDGNICIKAANLFLEYFHIDKGVCIRLKKNIPLDAGLAGGSSDAAATLRGLNRLFQTNASNEVLIALAKELGSDVPFFIQTKAALCTNRGEEIVEYLSDTPKIHIALIKPKFGLSTKAVYQNYKYTGESKTEKIHNVIQAVNEKNIEALKENIFNDLMSSALEISSELKDLYTRIKSFGIDVYLSGSGPTMYIIEPSGDDMGNLLELDDKDLFIQLCHTF